MRRPAGGMLRQLSFQLGLESACGFDITTEELTALHEDGGNPDRLEELGGLHGISQRLKVELATGIPAKEVIDRKQAFGVNVTKELPPKTYLAFLKDASKDFTVQLLFFCGVVSLVIAFTFKRDEELSWLEGVAILGTVAACLNLQAAQDWTKDRTFRKLNIPVMREGVLTKVLKFDIVVGDIVILNVGDVLEADGILIRGEEVEVDESMFTGEPEGVVKSPAAPFLFAGSAMRMGTGTYLVTSVGSNSVLGKQQALNDHPMRTSTQELEMFSPENDPGAITPHAGEEKGLGLDAVTVEVQEQDDDEKAHRGHGDGQGSILRQKLDRLIHKIAHLAFIGAGVTTAIMLCRFVYTKFFDKSHEWSWDKDTIQAFEPFITGILVIVVAVPEGLPIAVTLALMLSMKKMHEDNNLVKVMDATETMGSSTTICSDKTGTLTEGRMAVKRVVLGGREFAAGISAEKTCGKVVAESGALSDEFFEALIENICATKTAGTEIKWERTNKVWEQRGNKTDCAMLAFCHDMGRDYKEMRASPLFQSPLRGSGSGKRGLGLKFYPFSPERKRAAMAIPRNAQVPDGACRLYLKGASEMVLKLCTEEAHVHGHTTPMSDERREDILVDVVERFAHAGMRTIALAYRDFPEPANWEAQVGEAEALRLTGLSAPLYKVETQLVLMGIIGIIDPLRDGVPSAVERCMHAGVDVRMITGDHKATAIAIAKECGILRKGVDYFESMGEPLTHKYTALNGDEFRSKVLVKGKLDQAAFDEVWPYLRVMSRSSPEDKHTLIYGIKRSQLYKDAQKVREIGLFYDPQIVAVTGDGTNDAPALKRADVGIAMKISGTRVAQDASDIILEDDNFESVVKAIWWGRNVYDSIVKFLQFQLTVNVTATFIFLVGTIYLDETPVSVVQMLWMNFIMDSLGALSLAAEGPTPQLMERRPYGSSKSLVSLEIMCTVAGQSVYQCFVLMLVLFFGAGPVHPYEVKVGQEIKWAWHRGGFLNVETGLERNEYISEHYTCMFNVFVLMQMFNWINCRKLHFEWNPFLGMAENKLFGMSWVITLVTQVFLVQIGAITGDGTNPFFKTRALNFHLWAICVVLGAGCMPFQLAVVAAGRAVKARKGTNAEEHFFQHAGPVPEVPRALDVLNGHTDRPDRPNRGDKGDPSPKPSSVQVEQKGASARASPCISANVVGKMYCLPCGTCRAV